MNYGIFIFLGALVTMAISWCGLIIGPVFQFADQQPATIETTGGLYPAARSGLAQQGREVYRANGCHYCHTQQVHAEADVKGGKLMGYVGGDIKREWGTRPSVAEDYLMDRPVMFGTQRIGQDLINIGARQTNEFWHYAHLYNPQSVSPGSVMPAYRYLFEKQRIKGRLSPDALPLDENAGVEQGYQLIPKNEARALVAYLLSLEARTPLFVAPGPFKPGAEGDTNQPPAAPLTNAAAPAVAPK